MNTRSVRFRLTVWYSFVLFLAMAIIFATFYLVTKQTLLSHTDETLTVYADKVVALTTEQANNLHEAIVKQAFLKGFSESPGMLAIVVDSDGNIISSSVTTEINQETVSNLFVTASTTSKPYFTNRSFGTLTMRFLVTPVRTTDNTFVGAVLVGHPIDVIEKSLHSLLITLFTLFVILVIPIVFGGYFIARLALRPITAMSNKLQRITTENLDDRVLDPKTGDEIQELADTFNSLLDRISSSFKRERQFIGDLAHELKTPLATLTSGVEVVLSRKRSEKEYKEALSEVLIDANRVSTTLTHILDLAWSRTDKAKRLSTLLSLSETMNEAKEIGEKIAYSKKIRLQSNIAPEVTIAGNKESMIRVLLNVIDNAIKYTPTHGTIILSLSKEKNSAKITMKDTGTGIAKDDLPHIFERFYRGAKADSAFGSGLGLAIAKNIIDAHQGTIDVKSTVNKGTIVTILLPLTHS